MPARAGSSRIYVQIPAYRDPELLPTVTDLLATASRPERLRIGIAWQHGPGEEHLGRDLRRLGRVDLLTSPASQSRGVNWARSRLQERWDGEPYVLFLDSHHRFSPGWDEALVRLHREQVEAGVPKPVLTGYLPPYDPAHDPDGRTWAVFRMDLAERQSGLMFRLTGHAIPDWERLTAPVPAGYVSLHFLFAHGSFNEDVPSDPEVYFFADEVAVALRAYTHGYDLFHPHQVLGWHLYDRRSRTTHWADHPGAVEQGSRSLQRLRVLYAGADRGRHGIGNERTVADYEALLGRRLFHHDSSHDLIGG